MRAHAESVLADHGWSPDDVVAIVTLADRLDEMGLRALAERWQVDLQGYPADVLAGQDIPGPSARVLAATGTPGVAEAAVLARGAHLLVPKHTLPTSTVAVGRLG